MSRYGIYAVPSSFKGRNPAAFAHLQQMLLQSHRSPEFQDYIARNKLQDLSIGMAGEELDATFAADMVEIAKIK
jgi:hypothetical protein